MIEFSPYHQAHGPPILQHKHGAYATSQHLFKPKSGEYEHYRSILTYFWCYPCMRYFLSATNLTAHLRSATHTPKTIQCPGCPRAFVSRSALFLHYEAGRCPSGLIDEWTTDEWVYEFDVNRTMTFAFGEYVCPECRLGLKRLSAVAQHIESGACGAVVSGEVERVFERLVNVELSDTPLSSVGG